MLSLPRIRRTAVVGAVALGLTTATVLTTNAQATGTSDVIADLEATLSAQSCPSAATISALAAAPDDAVNAATVVRDAARTTSRVIDQLFAMYWNARGTDVTPGTYDPVAFTSCFAGAGFAADASSTERLRHATNGIAATDQQVQEIVRNGAATIDGTTHTASELSATVIEPGRQTVRDSSEFALALLLEFLAGRVEMLKYVTVGPPGYDGEAANHPAVNDAHTQASDTVDSAAESVPALAEAAKAKCSFRHSQSGDEAAGTNELTYTATTSTIWGQQDVYSLVTHRSTYVHNTRLKCVKFATMPDGQFDFIDKTPSPDNLACHWVVLEPYGYQKYYEFAPGFPNSGYMMRGVFDVALRCDAYFIPFLDVDVERDCPYNNVYAHFDGDYSWYYGDNTSVCSDRSHGITQT